MMTIFIVATSRQEFDSVLKTRIAKYFPSDYYEIGRGQFLVAFNGTAKALDAKLNQDSQSALNYYVIFGISGYYGTASMDMWEWIAAKLKG